jgi:RimJ/RimL family protein N-acetyltransferase
MPWARDEPAEPDALVQRLRRFRDEFDLGVDFLYGIFDREEREVLGGTGLHTRAGEGAREIGYWIHAAHVRRGYATEAAAALTRVAFELVGVERVEIRCDPKNEASAGVPRKLGFTLESVLAGDTIEVDRQPRDTMVWALLRGAYPTSFLSTFEVEAFDALGRRALLGTPRPHDGPDAAIVDR